MQLNAKVFHKAYCQLETYALVHISLEEAAMFVHLGFYDQVTSWSSSCDEQKNFATNILLKLVIKLHTGIRTIGLSRTRSRALKMRDCHYRISPIEYWGKGSTVGWYKVLGFLYL